MSPATCEETDLSKVSYKHLVEFNRKGYFCTHTVANIKLDLLVAIIKIILL